MDKDIFEDRYVGWTVFASVDMTEHDIARLVALAIAPNAGLMPPISDPKTIQVVADRCEFQHAAHLVNTLRHHGVDDWYYGMLPYPLYLMMLGDDEWHDYVPMLED